MLFFLVSTFVVGCLVMAPFSEEGRRGVGVAVRGVFQVLMRVILGSLVVVGAFYILL